MRTIDGHAMSFCFAIPGMRKIDSCCDFIIMAIGAHGAPYELSGQVFPPSGTELTERLYVLHCLTMDTITIRLPDDLYSDLRQISRKQHKPVSAIVRESIRRYVAIEKFRALRKKVLPFAEAQGFMTDEDVFKDGQIEKH
jgi:predicted transcriptional regulator